MSRRRKVDEPSMSDNLLLVKVEDLINYAFGPIGGCIVSFKTLQTILHILARHMRVLEQDIELRLADEDELVQRLRDEGILTSSDTDLTSGFPGRFTKKPVDKKSKKISTKDQQAQDLRPGGQMSPAGQIISYGQMSPGEQMMPRGQIMPGGQTTAGGQMSGGQVAGGQMMISGGQMTPDGRTTQGGQMMSDGQPPPGGQVPGGQMADGQMMPGVQIMPDGQTTAGGQTPGAKMRGRKVVGEKGPGDQEAGKQKPSEGISVKEDVRRDKGKDERVLIVEKGPTTRGGSRTRIGSIEVVTLPEFEQLKLMVDKLIQNTGGMPKPTMPTNEKLLSDLTKGTATLPDTMEAMQLNARVQAAEDALSRMADLLTQLAGAGALPPELASKIQDMEQNMQQMGFRLPRGDPQGKAGKGRIVDKSGRPVDQSGRPLNQSDQPIDLSGWPKNQFGRPVDQFGRPVDQYGRPVDPFGQPLDQSGRPIDMSGWPKDQFGRPVDQFGQIVDQFGRPIDASSKPLYQSGQPLDQAGRPKDQASRPLDQSSQPLDQSGRPVGQFGGPMDQLGQPVDEFGRLVGQFGRPMGQIGQPLDQFGRPLDQFTQPVEPFGLGVKTYQPGEPSVRHQDLEQAMEKMKKYLLESMANQTSKSSSTVEHSSYLVKNIADKMNQMTSLDKRVNDAVALMGAYAEQLSGFDAGLNIQLQCFKEQMSQLQTELKEGINQLESPKANPESAALVELKQNYETLLYHMEQTTNTHNNLTNMHGTVSKDLKALLKCVEILREQKADRDEVIDGLKDKASILRLKGLLSEKQFMIARKELDALINACRDKFLRQEEVWLTALKELSDITKEKATISDLLSLKQFATRSLTEHKEILKKLEIMLGEPKAAVLIRKLTKDAHCAACVVPAIQNTTEPIQPPLLPVMPNPGERLEPCVTSQGSVPPDLRKHMCKRWVGGSHTLVSEHVTRAPAHLMEPIWTVPTRHYYGDGADGRVYKMEEEMLPCFECNRTLPSPSEGDGDKANVSHRNYSEKE